MKLTFFLFLGLAGFFFTGCKKTDVTGTTTENGLPTDIKPSDIKFNLESVSHLNNQTSFVWKVVNVNPWSGQNQTGTKDMTDWLLVFKGEVPTITGAFYGSSLGSLTAVKSLDYISDKTSCFTGSALKFETGTKDGAPIYYVLVVQGNYNTGVSYAVISTKDADCSKHSIPGVFTDIH